MRPIKLKLRMQSYPMPDSSRSISVNIRKVRNDALLVKERRLSFLCTVALTSVSSHCSLCCEGINTLYYL